ncbi:biotin-dependent carboxyltransferase family protein [Chitinophaga agrisoli]|uniref:Biotin-dependent carboxyltransferase family protein n=1 Tax=Chitinophaga agrisoli TaxID=2607653 RepID=A0A5B2VS65_9BACT|nr:biotin-dependent carboxyltransferase family protein [Chitinophaga agrisoli]KAA2241470.1 biotin-dependent carboxyltransferase family protein [Chitinophaga agrisoli]
MLRVLQPGLLDTVQDAGRPGYQHLGINPGGVMDRVALSVANSLVGNELTEAVLELHFPATAFLFEDYAMIAISGADLGPMINDQPVPINKPLLVSRQAVLRFTRPVSGACCYLAIRHGLALTPWLGSNSTNLKANAGGFMGRSLHKNDVLPFRQSVPYNVILKKQELDELPWTADMYGLYGPADRLRITTGSAFATLDSHSQQLLTGSAFSIAPQSDRMGFRLAGPHLKRTEHQEPLSAGVTRGTIQLLPNGQLIILMADHQTTGGYPRVAHVITADQPALSQLRPRDDLRFSILSQEAAEDELWQQEQRLLFLQNACKLRLEEWLSHYGLH